MRFYIHQKSRVSFTLSSNPKTQKTISTHTTHQNDNQKMLSPRDITHLCHRSNRQYQKLLSCLQLNLFEFSCQSRFLTTPHQYPIKYVCSTLQPHDVLKINTTDYYMLFLKNKPSPICIQNTSKVFDSNGHRKSVLDVIYGFGPRIVLGVDSENRIEKLAIEKVVNQNPEDDEIDMLDTSFYELGIYMDPKSKTLSMDGVLVELD